MTNFKQSHVKLVFGLGAILILFLVFSDYYFQKDDDKQKAIRQEFVMCVSAVCLNKKVGQQCLEISPSITKIVIADDDQNDSAKRIILETGKDCVHHN